MSRRVPDSRPVYSSDGGRLCPKCGWPLDRCACSKASAPAASRDGIVRVGRQTQGRRGGGVTVVTGLPLDSAGLKELAGELKRLCGSGGTIKDGVVEIQGEHRDAVVAELTRRGYRVKRAGG